MRDIIIRVVLFMTGGIFSILITVVTVFLIYSFTLTGYDYGREAGRSITEQKPSRDIEINLSQDTPIDEVADLLKRRGVIDNVWLFKIDLRLKGVEADYPEGSYVVNTAMDVSEINAALRKKDEEVSTDVRITIIEGYSIPNIGSYLEDKEIVTAEEFSDACENGSFRYSFVGDIPERENRLEGYVFPDTYFISETADANEIVNKALSRFDQIYDSRYRQRAEELGLTMDQVVTIASIIEKETRRDDERAKVSAVIHNRLEQDMKLQMCSTVVHVLNIRRDRLTEEDLKVSSPYNTYVNAGLPPGPICNPGQACLEAALYPEEDSDILYFVLKSDETGEHLFTNDFDEFTAAKESYNQIY